MRTRVRLFVRARHLLLRMVRALYILYLREEELRKPASLVARTGPLVARWFVVRGGRISHGVGRLQECGSSRHERWPLDELTPATTCGEGACVYVTDSTDSM